MSKPNKEAITLLKTAKGHLEGIIKMTEEKRYCVDIANQIAAVLALLKKANLAVLKTHIETCVSDSFEQGTHEEKLDEVIHLLNKYMK